MNLDAFRKEQSSCIVRSKYFEPVSLAMDDSSDFQEKKKIAASKNLPKTSIKPKRARKIKGQKDIRKVLSSKKTELESYSKDFDKVCKQAGIGVDSEQLQVAIALSKSLQKDTTTVESQPSTSKDRVGKIRTTLLEYGFKVPEVKITKARRGKTTKKKYKLLQTTDDEKQQIIANKYSKLLFEDISRECCINFENTKATLYLLATNTTYNVLRDNNIFCVDKLIEETKSTGIFLKDWSLIPGRPVSPTPSVQNNMNFSDIECSQDELDIVLSGTHKNCQNIINSKTKCRKKLKISFEIEEEDETKAKDDLKVIRVKEDNIKSYNVDSTDSSKTNEKEDLIETFPSIQYRSCSPDLFDDEEEDRSKSIVSQETEHVADNAPVLGKNHEAMKTKQIEDDLPVLVENYEPIEFVAKSLTLRFPATHSQATKRNTNDFMEITSCVENKNGSISNITKCLGSQLSQKSDQTRRRSNDFMEITNCVVSAEPSIHECEIDLTESPKSRKNLASNQKRSPSIGKIKETHIDLTQNNTIEAIDVNDTGNNLDLTQSSDNSDELPVVILSTNKSNSADETIIMDPKEYENVNSDVPENDVLDLTQENGVKCVKSPCGNFFEEFIHNHSDSPENNINVINVEEVQDKINTTLSPNLKNVIIHSNTSTNKVDPHASKNDCIDLTQIENVSYNNSYLSQNNSQNDKSDSIDITQLCHNKNDDIQNNPGLDIVKYGAGECNDDIDLTQSSDSSNKTSQKSLEIINQEGESINLYKHSTVSECLTNSSQRYSSLGKIGGVSIDYDDENQYNVTEILDLDKNKTQSERDLSTENLNDIDVDLAVINDDFDLNYNCSQNSEVFDISDKELNYSMIKSKLDTPRIDNFNFGGISILDDLSKADSYRKSSNTDNSEANNHQKTPKEINNDLALTKNKVISQICTPPKSSTSKTLAETPQISTIEINYEISPIKHRRITEICTPQKAGTSNSTIVETPINNTKFIVKTVNVTPMPEYELMSTPQIHRELDKYGIKPFKRKRAIQLLSHLYNQTHPIIEYPDEMLSPAKKQKPNNKAPRKLLAPTRKVSEFTDNTKPREIVIENKNNGDAEIKYEVTNDPIIKEVISSPDEWVFQKREKAKLHTCRLPLHIAFHNYVTSRRGLREAILCYEPINIDVIHKDLVGYGHKYDAKDLLKFLDKKCITVKTTDNDARNEKR